MAWLVLTWKILRIFQSQFLFREVCADTRHSSYTKTLPTITKQIKDEKNLSKNYNFISVINIV